MADQPHTSQPVPASEPVSEADRKVAERRRFLKSVGTKAMYAAPAVATLAAASRANAASATSPS